ncbi:MAG: SprT-like domain-containing protein [Gemmatimonadales bacterium]|nr:SprT-like domain-containing protein [Gemmatimonadales bacterium]
MSGLRERLTGRGPGLDHRLRILGLRADIVHVVTHLNRSVMLSLNTRGVLRLHQGYTGAPDRVLRAVVRFLNPRLPRAVRRLAEREFLAFPVEEHAPPAPATVRPVECPQPGDLMLLHRLEQAHAALNQGHFGGALGTIPIRLSGRMRTRLGELSVDLRTGCPIEIALSRRHIAQHAWSEVQHTLLHEMVHQWQAETGQAVDHGPEFRRKAREVGVLPHARRIVQTGMPW